MNFQYRAIGTNDFTRGQIVVNTVSFEEAYAVMMTMWNYDSACMQVWCGDRMITEIKSN